jgi:GNAT superfamily N-acetyltransferase
MARRNSKNRLISKSKLLPKSFKKQIYEGFSRHAIEMTGHDEKFDGVAFVAMESAILAGAIVVERFWDALHVKYLYVDDYYRNQGIGTRLMQRAKDFDRVLSKGDFKLAGLFEDS